MSFAFKRFNFFKPQQICKHGFPPNASCVLPGGQMLWVGTESGSIYILDSQLLLVGSFNAHGHKVLEVLWLERRKLLVTVGVEEPGCSSTTVKLWAAERLVTAASPAADEIPGIGVTGAAVGSGSTGPNPLASTVASMTTLKATKVFGMHGGQQYPESPVTAAAALEGSGSGSASDGSTWATGSSSTGNGEGITHVTIALGLASGSVVVLVGEVHGMAAGGGPLKAKLSHSRRLSARPDEGDLLSVTGLELTGTSDLLSLFVVTESQTLCFHLQTNTKMVLDPHGASSARCCCLRPGGSLLTVARAEGLYDYTADTRAGCTAFEGTKQGLTTFGKYLVVVTRDDSASAAASSAGSNLLSNVGSGLGLSFGLGAGRVKIGVGSTSGGGGSSCLQLADVRTKLLAGTFVLQGLQHVFCAWGAVHAVTASGIVWSYREIGLASQLEALLRRSLFKLSLDVARAWGAGAADASTFANIHQRWGDHLYSKGEYDAAMTQYLETVGQLEPSYVIRRFLDAQRIHNLTAYLEVMHERGLATSDHTTLLLNCYTKLKDVSKLDAFIRRGGVGGAAPLTGAPGYSANGASTSNGVGGGGPGAANAAFDGAARRPRRRLISAAAAVSAAAASADDALARTTTLLAAAGAGGRKQQQQACSSSYIGVAPLLRFDADTAVRVLRGAGYAEHALWVADAAGQIDAVLDILLEELADADDAIAYLEALPRSRRAEALKKYGKALIGMRAEAATGLIMDLCCGPHPGSAVESTLASGPYYLSSVSDFAHLYSGEPTALMLLCEYILNTNTEATAASAQAVDDGDNGAAAERLRAYERLLYHTLLELYLADHLWLQPQQQPSPRPTAQSLQNNLLSQPQHMQRAVRSKAQLLVASTPAMVAIPVITGSGGGGSNGRAPDAHDIVRVGESLDTVREPEQRPGLILNHGGVSAPVRQAVVDSTLLETRRAKALDILARGWPSHVQISPDSSVAALNSSNVVSGVFGGVYGPSYDPEHALVLCRVHGFRKGLLFLYDRLRLPREALQVYMSCGDHAGLILAVLKYGDVSRGGDPVLWSEVLEYFVAQHDANLPESDCSAQIMQVVEHVERSGVLPPLVVLQTLSRSRRLPLSMVRGYIERALQRDMTAVSMDREAVSKLAAETAALREEVIRLRTQPRLVQASRCSASGAPLELPAAHFLCGHSFNLRQLGDNDRECPICGPDQRRVAEIRASMQATSMQPERFFAELRQAVDGFSVVAEHFGRGLMNVTPAAAAASTTAAAGVREATGLVEFQTGVM